MRYFIILISFICITSATQAQSLISINASAEVLVPADEISFRIDLNALAKTPQEAYDLHQKREKVLVDLLKKYNIEENNIHFEPISISKVYGNQYGGQEDQQVQTRQTVILSLDDFDIYEKIQITLIENDFDNFSGSFSSSETQQAEDEALKKALKTAREKADIIAEEKGLTILEIKEISYSHNQGPPRPMMEMRAAGGSGSLMEFNQTVSISANVSVSYAFREE